MIDCKSMPTPMMINLKKMNGDSFDSIRNGPHLYKHFIRSLLYLVNIVPDICYAMSVVS
jgi:hypothetical protein